MIKMNIIKNIIRCVYYFYSYIKNVYINLLPENMFKKKITIVKNNLNYDILHYKYKYNNKYNDIYILNDETSIQKQIKLNKMNKYKIYHACIMKREEYIKDITDIMRGFSHYLDIKTFENANYIKNYINIQDDEKICVFLDNFIKIDLS